MEESRHADPDALAEHPPTVRDAVREVLTATAPSKSGKGRRWFQIARLLAQALASPGPELERLRARVADLEAELRDLRELGAGPQALETVRCYASKKVIFASEDAARRSARRKSDRLRVYLCPDCHGWHMTSRVGE